MEEISVLRDLVIILTVSLVVVYVFLRLKQSTIVGFIIAGVLIGPSGLSLISNIHQVEVLAEIGVILLLFTIGLEFSFKKLTRIREIVLVGGGVQVLLTLILTAAVVWTLSESNVQSSIFMGFLVALSSTAIVLKSLQERGEVDSPQGKFAVGMLIFQDICVVPMMLFTPMLAQGEFAFKPIFLAFGKSLLMVALIVVGARFLIPKILHQVVRARSREIFVISVILICIGTAWLTSQFGVSLAIGAFIAGLVVADSEYSHQVLSDIIPFRDTFSGLFFISVGMLMSLEYLSENLFPILAFVVILVIGKATVVAATVLLFRYSLRIGALTGLALAQIGEFSFILSKFGKEYGLIAEDSYQTFLSASIVTMFLTPFLIRLSPLAGNWVMRFNFPPRTWVRKVDISPEQRALREIRDHVIVVGYGLNGRNLSRVLKENGLPYVILELNPETVRETKKVGEPIFYGDATSREIMERMGIGRAKVIVFAISDPASIRRSVKIVRSLNPNLHILVRTRYMGEIDELYKLGADEVIPEEFEISIEIASRVLRYCRVPRNVITEQIQRIREEKYEMFRDLYMPKPYRTEMPEVLSAIEMERYLIRDGSSAAGKSLSDLQIRKGTGASVIAVIRNGNAIPNPGADFVLESGDTVVLVGSWEEINRAVDFLERRS